MNRGQFDSYEGLWHREQWVRCYHGGSRLVRDNLVQGTWPILDTLTTALAVELDEELKAYLLKGNP